MTFIMYASRVNEPYPNAVLEYYSGQSQNKSCRTGSGRCQLIANRV